MKAFGLAILAAVLSAAVFAAQPRAGGILRVPLGGDVSSLDPTRCYELPGMIFVRTLYQTLVDYGDGTDVIPVLCRSWTASTNGLEYTFELEPRVRFSNGRQVVAEDYVYSLERMLTPRMRCPGAFIYGGIHGVKEFQQGAAEHVAGVQALEALRLKITLERPDLTFLYRMAMPFAAPVCREMLEERLSDIGTHSAGAGPFMLKRWVRGAAMELVRNPYYGGALPAHLDGVRATIGIDDATGQMMFERQEVDLADLKQGVAGAEFPRIMETPALRENLEAELSSIISYVPLNNEIPPLDNKLVRRAMNYAVNKERLLEMLAGRAVRIPGVLPPVVPEFQPELGGYEYDPEKARTLLKEAGYENGFTTSMIFPNATQEIARMVAAIQEDLRQVGITLEATPLSFATYLEKSQRRRAAATCFAAWSEDFPDASNYLDALLNGENIAEKDCQNLAFYNNPEVNTLLNTAATSLDKSERRSLYQKAERMVLEDAPWIFLYSLKQYVLHQPWLKNTKPHVVWAFRFEKMWMER